MGTKFQVLDQYDDVWGNSQEAMLVMGEYKLFEIYISIIRSSKLALRVKKQINLRVRPRSDALSLGLL